MILASLQQTPGNSVPCLDCRLRLRGGECNENVPALYSRWRRAFHSVSPGEGGRNAGGRGRRLSSNRDFLFLVNLSSSRPRKAPASPYFRIDFARFAILPAPKSFMTIVMSHNATVEYPISMSRCAQKSLQTVSTPLATAINSLDMRWHTTPPIPSVAQGRRRRPDERFGCF